MFSCACVAEPLPADPTKPAAGSVAPKLEEQATQEFKLSSLLHRKNKHIAVINGTRVMTGDTVDGAKVIAIKSTSVTLDVGGKQKEISLAMRKGFSKVKSQ